MIPIFWNKRAEEKEGVLAVAEEVNVLLTEVSLQASSWRKLLITAHNLLAGSILKH